MRLDTLLNELVTADRYRRSSRPWLIVILFTSLCINTIGLSWGLPDGNATWAADSLRPLVPLAIAKRAFWEEKWNSGWFTKYPLGHPLVLMSVQSPYVAWLRFRGEFGTSTATYPYGFGHPEQALTTLALISRAVSAVMGVALVALAYGITSTLFGITAGVCTALLVAGCYPIVFYAHTANVDLPALLWMALAFWAALVSADRRSRAAATLTGAAAAMALFTKEQTIGALVGVPLVWLLRCHFGSGLKWRRVIHDGTAAATGFVTVMLVAGNVWWNPSGFLNRWRFLAGVLPVEIREKYLPYQSMIQVPKFVSLSHEVERLLKVVRTVAEGLTAPVFVVCVAGVAWALWRRPRQAVIPLLLFGGYYVVSSRALELVPVRYTIPLMFFCLLFGGAAAGAALERSQRLSNAGRRKTLAVALLAALGTLALLPGIEIDRLLLRDPRYAAEAWLREHVSAGARLETYQRPTYLPRFGPTVQAVEVPMEDRTIEGFQERQPDFVVLSSGGRAGLSGRYQRNWQPGQPVVVDSAAAQEFFDHLRGEQLGYRAVAHFHTPTCWVTPRINSVNPEITIFARQQTALRR